MAYSTFKTYEARDCLLKGKIIAARIIATKDKLLVKSIAPNGFVDTRTMPIPMKPGGINQEECEFFVFDALNEANQFLNNNDR
ncbi:MAG TPA: hypothetical protein VF596_18750 [Pyrinomonadaceae bacterium]|jgi:hypothetical protein